MILIKELQINNFRNIKKAVLENFGDLNIIIGPNNSGKTNILEIINEFQKIHYGEHQFIGQTGMTKPSTPSVQGIELDLETSDFYLDDPKNNPISLNILFNREEIEKIVPDAIERQEMFLRKIVIEQRFLQEAVTIGSLGTTSLFGRYFSPFIDKDIIEEIRRNVMYCPEGRLQSYKGKDFVQYKEEKKLRGSQKRIWIDFLKKNVDPRIDDERDENLVKKINEHDYETPILKQGSGVRSLTCLAVDILFSDKKIILIDEPELGLNPFVKQEFLKFLLKLSNTRQIFVATHDSTFVNLTLWDGFNVSVFFYSPMTNGFLKIDLTDGNRDPSSFAGFMTHTTSLKNNHIYVEGPSDVYILQVFIKQFLKSRFNNDSNWIEIWNKTGIYHLGGDFWSHLLYTVPKTPYKCLIILDGDKKDTAKDVCKKLNMSHIAISQYNLIDKVNSLLKYDWKSEENGLPIYCLERSCIEEYLDPKPDYNSSNYKKKIDGPRIAEKMDNIPEELENVFTAIISSDPQ